MQMTETEIVRRFKNGSEKPTTQIKILAELNACDKKTIRDILEKHGCEVPHYNNRFTVKKALEEAAVVGDPEPKTESSDPKPKRKAAEMDPFWENLGKKDPVEVPPVVTDLVLKRMAEIDEAIKPLELRLEELSAEYNILKAWMDSAKAN